MTERQMMERLTETMIQDGTLQQWIESLETENVVEFLDNLEKGLPTAERARSYGENQKLVDAATKIESAVLPLLERWTKEAVVLISTPSNPFEELGGRYIFEKCDEAYGALGIEPPELEE